jgi:hypothetical protein
MVRKLIITENDRRNILSMHNLLTEADKVTVKGRVVGEINTDTNVWSTKKETVGLPNYTIFLYKLLNDGITLNKISETKTDNDGYFNFSNIDSLDNLRIKIFGGETFTDKKLTVTKEDLGDIYLPFKNPVGVEVGKPSNVEPCKGFESTEDTFYGYGQASNKIGDLIETESIKLAKNDAINQYLIMYPNENVNVEDILLYGFKYEVVCSDLPKEFIQNLTTNVIKVEKKTIDDVILKIIENKNKPQPEEMIEFEDIDFDVAVKKSYDYNKPIFLFFGLDTHSGTQNVMTILQKNKDVVKKINTKYIPLYYYVDKTNDKRYMASSEALGIRTYPSIVILKAIKNPDENYIKDSIKIIKLEDRIADNLDNINTLFD